MSHATLHPPLPDLAFVSTATFEPKAFPCDGRNLGFDNGVQIVGYGDIGQATARLARAFK